jgi:hypothetical protein
MRIDEMEQAFSELVSSFHLVSADEIPDIDLYMDQVTTFMEQKLSPYTRDPEHDKILTKTMINNYAKSSLLVPPVRKKYGTDHMLLLLFIFYMKSFLQISDIEEILAPVKDRYVAPRDTGKKGAKAEEPKSDITLRQIYTEVAKDIRDDLPALAADAQKTFARSRASFAEAPEEDREILQEFDLLCRLSAEIYLKKLYIERTLDARKQTSDSSKKTKDAKEEGRQTS